MGIMEGHNTADDLNNVLFEALAAVSEAGDTLQIRKPGGIAVSRHSEPQLIFSRAETCSNSSASTIRSPIVDVVGITALIAIAALIIVIRQKVSTTLQRSSNPKQCEHQETDSWKPNIVELRENGSNREPKPMQPELNVLTVASKNADPASKCCNVQNAPPLVAEEQVVVVPNPHELSLQFKAAVPLLTVERELELAEEYQRQLATRAGPPLSQEALQYARQKIAEETELTLRCQQEARQYYFDYQQRTTDRKQARENHKEAMAVGREEKEWLNKLQDAWNKCVGYLNLGVFLRMLLPPILRSFRVAYHLYEQGVFQLGINLLSSTCANENLAASTTKDMLQSATWIAYGLQHTSSFVNFAVSLMVSEETQCIAKNLCLYLLGFLGAAGLLFFIGHVSNLSGMAPYIKSAFQSVIIIFMLVSCNILSLDWVQYAMATSLVGYVLLSALIQYKYVTIRDEFLKREHAPSSQQVTQRLVDFDYAWLAPAIFTVYSIYEVARYG